VTDTVSPVTPPHYWDTLITLRGRHLPEHGHHHPPTRPAVQTRIASRLSKPSHHRPPIGATTKGDPDNGPPSPCPTPAIPPSSRTKVNNATRSLSWHNLHDSRTANGRIVSIIARASTPRCENSFSAYTGGVFFTRLGGGQPLSTCAVARPHARIYKTIALHKHKTGYAPTTAITPGPDLPPITCIEDWASLLHTHTHEAFVAHANLHGNHTCPPVIDSSGHQQRERAGLGMGSPRCQQGASG
jgi:hypothetical protein